MEKFWFFKIPERIFFLLKEKKVSKKKE